LAQADGLATVHWAPQEGPLSTPDASEADDFRHRYGPWAVIAGGSEGIGQCFAQQLAARGLHLVLLARRAPALEETAARLRATHAVQVVTASVDLTAGQLEQTVPALCSNKDVGLVIYNAGSMHGAGLFLDQPFERSLGLVQLNCVGPLWFTHYFGRRLQQRGRGGIVLMSSMAGLAGTGFAAAYAATKAFDIVLAESLWFELRLMGVDVLGLIAGATRTPAMERSGVRFRDSQAPAATAEEAGPNVVPMEPGDVAAEALAHLGEGPVWIAGARNRDAADWLRTAARDEIVTAMSTASAQLYGLVIRP
jgi:short-subunit dehydrogenase